MAKRDQRVNSLCTRALEGAQVSVMDLGKVRASCEQWVAEGLDDESVVLRVRAFVDTIRVDR